MNSTHIQTQMDQIQSSEFGLIGIICIGSENVLLTLVFEFIFNLALWNKLEVTLCFAFYFYFFVEAELNDWVSNTD